MSPDPLVADRLKPSRIVMHHATVPPGFYMIEKLEAGPPVWRVVLVPDSLPRVPMTGIDALAMSVRADSRPCQHIVFHQQSPIWPDLQRAWDCLEPIEVRGAAELPAPPNAVADDRAACVDAVHRHLRLAGDAIARLVEHGCHVAANVHFGDGDSVKLRELTGEIDVEVHAVELLEPSGKT